MDQHNSNLYTVNANKESDIFGGYVRNPCTQTSTTQRQHFLPPYPMPVSNNISQSLMYNTHQNQSVYNIMYPHQSVYRNQNSFTSNYSQAMDWPEACMKNTDYKDKYLSEKKKESCCMDSISTNDVYKTKNLYNYNKNAILDSQWYYGNCDSQKYSELPSCSQITAEKTMSSCFNMKDNKSDKSVKYCSIQKLPESDPKLFGYPKQYDANIYINQYNKLPKDYPSCSQLTQTCNLYSTSTCLEIDKKILLDQCELPNVCDVQNVCDILPNQYYQTPDSCVESYINVSKLPDKPDETNCGESDIVVEDSDEDTDESEEIEKEELNPCVICNSNAENNLYDISCENTVTSYSRTRVSEKLYVLFRWTSDVPRNICSVCMSLLNTLDNLEIQLETVKQELSQKYKNAMKMHLNNNVQDLEIEVDKNAKINSKASKKKFRSLMFKCRICQKVFSFQKFYKNHISKHKLQKKVFSCMQCNYTFPSRQKLKLHLKNHREKCSLCYEVILPNLKHKCQETNDRQFICYLCGKPFKTKVNLIEHENFCSGELPFKCEQCDKRFPSASKMNQHVKLIHKQLFTDQCKICNKGFIKKSDYNSHMLSHSTEKQFLCKICGKIYKSLSNLNHHKKIHSEKLPYTCTICQKGFLRKINLETHLNTHNNVKPFTCVVCQKNFACQKNLDAHVKIHNGTIKKKTCNICGKQLVHGLEEHMRIHSNFKTFTCGECPMKFLTKGALAKHTKRKHENKELDVLQL